MVAKLYARGLGGTTTIILSAKHGQSPTDRAALTRVDDGPIISGINAAWHGVHPHTGDLVAAATDDDVLQLWLTDRSQPAADFVRHYLLTHRATGNDVNGAPTTVRASGLRAVHAGAPPPATSASRSPSPGTPTSSASSGTASSIPAARARSPNTAEPASRTAPFPSWSAAPAYATGLSTAPGSRPPADRPHHPAPRRRRSPRTGRRTGRAHPRPSRIGRLANSPTSA